MSRLTTNLFVDPNGRPYYIHYKLNYNGDVLGYKVSYNPVNTL